MLALLMRAYVAFAAVVFFASCVSRSRSRSGPDELAGGPDALLAICLGACQIEYTPEGDSSELVRDVCHRRCLEVVTQPRIDDAAGLAAMSGEEVLVVGRLEPGRRTMCLRDGTRVALELEQTEAADLTEAEGHMIHVFGRIVPRDAGGSGVRVRYAVKAD